MTLGKIERFWATLWQNFLCRAQFESFESARERIKLWIQYYNHKRPHQAIGGLCPADRFFEIQSELRKTIEAGIKDNLLEMALRGQPRAPFYMVGRMEGQSVVLRAEKGKLKLSVGAEGETQQPNEVEYDLKQNLNRKGSDEGNNQNDSNQNRTNSATADTGHHLQCGGKGTGGAGGLDRSSMAGRSVPATLDQRDHLQPVAGAGDGRNAPGAREPGELKQRRSLEPAVAEPAQSPNAAPGQRALLLTAGEDPVREPQRNRTAGELNEQEQERSGGPGAGGDNPPSAFRADERERGSTLAGDLAQNLLSMGEARAAGDDGAVARAGTGTSAQQRRTQQMTAMQARIQELEAKLKVAEQTAEVRAILRDMERAQEKRALKKKKRK